MIQKLLRHKDPRWTWKLMCNRWPEEFRDRVATEVSGPNGVPLTPQNPFTVEIRLADSEEIQTDFEVEEPDGSISHLHYDPYGWRGNEKPANNKRMQLRNLRFAFRSNGFDHKLTKRRKRFSKRPVPGVLITICRVEPFRPFGLNGAPEH
jgi:hypothetical protein